MDALDIRILRTMGIVPYGATPQGPDALKPGHVAEALGVTAETVRERVQRLERAGVIQGYQAYPNLRHLGLEACGLLFRVEGDERRAALAKAVEPVEGLVDLFFFLGDEVCMDLCYRSAADLERKKRLLSTLTGDADPALFYGWPLPPVARPLTHLDWRIVRALRGRARRPLAEVAVEVGVSYRTAKRRYDQLTTEGSLFTVPLVDPSREGGHISCAFLFYLHPDADAGVTAAIRKAFDDTMVSAVVPATPRLGNFDLLAFASSPAEIERLRRLGAAIPGVARVEALVHAGFEERSGWIDEAIEERVAATAPAGARA